MVKGNFLYRLFPIYQNVGWILSRKTKKGFKKKVLKGIKRQYSCKRYRNFSKEDKKKTRKYGCKHCNNLSENEKQRQVECRRNHPKMWTNKD